MTIPCGVLVLNGWMVWQGRQKGLLPILIGSIASIVIWGHFLFLVYLDGFEEINEYRFSSCQLVITVS